MVGPGQVGAGVVSVRRGVGLLFEIWIVDASILRCIDFVGPRRVCGWGLGLVCFLFVFVCRHAPGFVAVIVAVGVCVGSLWCVMSVHREPGSGLVLGLGWWCV